MAQSGPVSGHGHACHTESLAHKPCQVHPAPGVRTEVAEKPRLRLEKPSSLAQFTGPRVGSEHRQASAWPWTPRQTTGPFPASESAAW